VSGIIVLKFGGTSLATPGRVRLAARRVRTHVRGGRRVVVVASAAGRATDGILARAARLAPPRQPDVPGTDTEGARELDRALATGEDRSTALLAATLWGLGVAARSLRGGEAGVRAEGGFGTGRIVMVDPRPIHHLLDQGVVPVVSGFQGRRSDGETVTLGRGGSDTTAVAIAAALGAICHLVSDVPAVYDRDPNRDRSAHPFASLGHGELVALIDGGERVIHPSAAELARDASVPLRLYHFRAPLAGSGTRIEAAPAGVAADNGRRA
jgi:aspartate kinase